MYPPSKLPQALPVAHIGRPVNVLGNVAPPRLVVLVQGNKGSCQFMNAYYAINHAGSHTTFLQVSHCTI